MPTEAVGASLWLDPDEPGRSRFAERIEALAAELGTPRFEPHVTLLGGLEAPEAELERRARSLAAALPPLDLELMGVAAGEEYFRFLHVEAALSEALADARRRAATAFGVDPGGYLPHLSLAYAEPGGHAAAALCRRLSGRVEGRLPCSALALVRTSGPPAAWRLLARLPLAG